MIRKGMSRLVIVVLLGVTVLFGVIVISILDRGTSLENREDFEVQLFRELCPEGGGTWIGGHNECEWVDAAYCNQAMGGTFIDCMSPCRHDKDATACTMNCVPVCKFRN